MLKKIGILFIICLVVICEAKPIFAEIVPTYKGYTYDGGGQVVPAPNVYTPIKVLDGNIMGSGHFNKPEDMFITKDGDIYILDSGNNRVVICDENLTLQKIISEVTKDGESSQLADAKGIYVNEKDEIIIADKGNARVIVMDNEGKISMELTKPDIDLISETTLFEPIKAVQDSKGNTYVISKNFYQGMIVYDEKGDFNGFFGGNKVKGNLKILSDYMYRRIMTKEQKDLMAKYVPTELMSVEIDDEGYLYTTAFASESEDVIKRLNPTGTNTLSLDKDTVGQLKETKFTDITITDEQYMYALDLEKGKVYELDPYGLNITTFGGLGDQQGLFKEPVAVEYRDGVIYVLDRVKRNITLFTVTEFGEILHEAINLYNRGLYEQAIEPWQEVLKRNANYNLAYIGLGDAYMNIGEYKLAMKNYKLAQDRDSYNKAFQEYRVEVIRKYLGAVLTLGVAVFLMMIFIKLNKSYQIINKFLKNKDR